MDPNNSSVFENKSFYMTLLVLNIVITVASSRHESSFSWLYGICISTYIIYSTVSVHFWNHCIIFDCITDQNECHKMSTGISCELSRLNRWMHNGRLLCKDAYQVTICNFLVVDDKNLSEAHTLWKKYTPTGYMFGKSGLVQCLFPTKFIEKIQPMFEV